MVDSEPGKAAPTISKPLHPLAQLSDAAQSRRNEHVLSDIYFDTMRLRRETIKDARMRALEWFFADETAERTSLHFKNLLTLTFLVKTGLRLLSLATRLVSFN